MDRLIKLQNSLQTLQLSTEAEQVNLLRLAIMGPTPQKEKEMKEKSISDKEYGTIHMLLDLIGLVPGAGETADLANAALYLQQGPTPKNLFSAAVSIVSMIAGLGDSAKLFKYIGTAFEARHLKVLQPIAKKILDHAGTVKAIFTRLKSTEVIKHINAIPKGELLVKFADKMFDVIIGWCKNLLSSAMAEGIDSLIRNN